MSSIVGLLSLLSITSMYAQGSFLVQSNRTDTNVTYALTMVSSSSGSSITLTATLTKAGVPLANTPISFYRSAVDLTHTGINSTVLSTVLTDATGKATYNDITTTPGLYHHVAEYTAL